MKYFKPKGTRDFFPENMSPRKKIFAKLNEVASRYGFGEVETPAFENLDLLTAKGGSEITSQIFTLEQKGNEQFGLRFDLTVPCTRMFLEKQLELPKPVKWFYLTRMWRYEAPQKGRLREFYQWGVELFGSSKPEADAEVISLAIDALKSLGLTEKDFVIKLNNRKLLQGLLLGLEIKDNLEAVIRIVDKAKKISATDFEKELAAIGLNKEQIDGVSEIMTINSLLKISKVKINDEAKQGIEELSAVIEVLKKLGNEKFIELDLSIARGLSYYTGTVFEGKDRKEALRSIFGGGRYDSMIEQFGGNPEPATGFAMGDVVLEILLKEKKLWPEEKNELDYFILFIGDTFNKSAEIISKLREKYSVEYDLMGRNIKKQLDYANKRNAKKVIFIGEDELKQESVKIKDMKTGKEELIKIKDLFV